MGQYGSRMEHQDVAAHEKRAIAEVRVRLAERFPAVERAVVDEAIDAALARLDGRVRDFIPILVERAAAEQLGRIRDELDPIAGSREPT